MNPVSAIAGALGQLGSSIANIFAQKEKSEQERERTKQIELQAKTSIELAKIEAAGAPQKTMGYILMIFAVAFIFVVKK